MRRQHARRQRLRGIAVRIVAAAASAPGPARARCRRAASRRAAAASARRSSRRWSIRRRPRPRRRRRSGRSGRRDRLAHARRWSARRGPETLADGATTGPPNARRISRATGCAGTRTAMVSSPAVARSATGQPAAFGSTSVSGPGQNAFASLIGLRVEPRDAPCGGEIADMGDQRIERRPALGLIQPRDRRPHWWRRRRARRRSRSGTRPARRRARQRAAAARRPRLPAKIGVVRPTFIGICASSIPSSCGGRNPRL